MSLHQPDSPKHNTASPCTLRQVNAKMLCTHAWFARCCPLLKKLLTVQMSPVKIDAAKRQLFSLTQSQNPKLQAEAAQPSKASPTAEAVTKKEAKEVSPPTENRKEQKQQVKPQKQRLHSLANGTKLGKAVPIKRKRKEEAEVKVWPLLCPADHSSNIACWPIVHDNVFEKVCAHRSNLMRMRGRVVGSVCTGQACCG